MWVAVNAGCYFACLAGEAQALCKKIEPSQGGILGSQWSSTGCFKLQPSIIDCLLNQ
jgi:hypothetical protein